jgi:hypothetical protein
MKAVVATAFCGPVRIEIIERRPGRIVGKVTSKNNRYYKLGEIEEFAAWDVYLKHRFVGYHSEYSGRP